MPRGMLTGEQLHPVGLVVDELEVLEVLLVLDVL